MNIISDKSEKVNSEYLSNWKVHKLLSLEVSKKMLKINTARGYRMKDCGRFIKAEYCNDCDSYFIKSTNLCRDRFCPTCNWRLALQRYANMTILLKDFFLAYPETKLTFVTLTAKNCSVDELSDTMEKMSKSWHNLLCRRTIKREIFGTAKSVEVTYNKQTKEFHPHFHIIIAWARTKESDCKALSKEFINGWISCCKKNDLTVSIKAQCAKPIYGKIIEENGKEYNSMADAIVEVFKYAFKSKQLDDMPLYVFRKFVYQFANKRLISFTGKFADYARKLKLNMEKVEEDDIKICKHCGSSKLDELIYEWSFGQSRYIQIQDSTSGNAGN